MAEVSGRSSGRKAWAATPPHSARPSSVRNPRASAGAGSSGGRPEPGQANRVGRERGAAGRGCPRRGRRSRPRSARTAPATGRPSAPRPAAVSATERCSTAGRAAVEGMAQSISGQHQRQPVPVELEAAEGRRRRRPSDAPPSTGRAPGRARSPRQVRVPPPISAAASSTVTSTPARASTAAATSPFGPAADHDGSTSRGALERPAGRCAGGLGRCTDFRL